MVTENHGGQPLGAVFALDWDSLTWFSYPPTASPKIQRKYWIQRFSRSIMPIGKKIIYCNEIQTKVRNIISEHHQESLFTKVFFHLIQKRCPAVIDVKIVVTQFRKVIDTLSQYRFLSHITYSNILGKTFNYSNIKTILCPMIHHFSPSRNAFIQKWLFPLIVSK